MTAVTENILNPDVGLVIWTLVAVVLSAGAFVLVAIRVVRAMRKPRDQGHVTSLRATTNLQEEVDALQAEVARLTEANRFLEQLVGARPVQSVLSGRQDSAP